MIIIQVAFLTRKEKDRSKKKIRLRRYINNNNYGDYKLETKISSFEGRFKSVKNLNKNESSKILNLGLMDNMYGCVYQN